MTATVPPDPSEGQQLEEPVATIVDRLRAAAGQARRPIPEMMREAADEIERLWEITDPELSVRELALKVSSGRVFIDIVSDPTYATKLLAAMMYAYLTSNGKGEMPPNYLTTDIEGLAEVGVSPAGEFAKYRCIIEVVKPGGRSSHEIRLDLESELKRRSTTPP